MRGLFPVWIWGVIASTIIDVPISLAIKKNIKKNDPSFIDYYKERSKFAKGFDYAKTLAKMFVPLLNVGYPFWLIINAVHLGFGGLAEKYMNKINNFDYHCENIKLKFNELKSKLSELIDKIKSLVNKKVNEKGKNNTKTSSTVNKVSPNKSSVDINQVNTVVKTPQKEIVSSKTTDKHTVKQNQNNSTTLNNYYDMLNNSALSKEELLKFYDQEYWKARKEYDELTDNNKKMEVYNKLLLIYTKRKEIKESLNVEQGPILSRK